MRSPRVYNEQHQSRNPKLEMDNELPKIHSLRAWLRPQFNAKSMVNRLWPIVLGIAITESIMGVGILTFLMAHIKEYDRIYDTEDSRVMSTTSSCGLILLVVTGMMLLISVLLDKRRIMRLYILTSTFLCIYMFALSVLQIHFALLALERDTYKMNIPQTFFLLNNACAIGFMTLLGSVVHFVGNVAAFTYYNLKYVQPMLLNGGP